MISSQRLSSLPATIGMRDITSPPPYQQHRELNLEALQHMINELVSTVNQQTRVLHEHMIEMNTLHNVLKFLDDNPDKHIRDYHNWQEIRSVMVERNSPIAPTAPTSPFDDVPF